MDTALYFFFFQAEDGIRDTSVTGVQTCALPIYALPIEEKSGVPFASEIPGVMHACGHDAHTAMLLGAAQLLHERRQGFAGTIKLMFQPAEEGGAGAARMIEDGVLANPQVDAAFMLHVYAELEAGQVACGPGPLLAGADSFTITIEGRGRHAARPHQPI